jgi:hypothetical protein
MPKSSPAILVNSLITVQASNIPRRRSKRQSKRRSYNTNQITQFRNSRKVNSSYHPAQAKKSSRPIRPAFSKVVQIGLHNKSWFCNSQFQKSLRLPRCLMCQIQEVKDRKFRMSVGQPVAATMSCADKMDLQFC